MNSGNNKRAKKGHIRPTYKCNLCEEMKDLSELKMVKCALRPLVFFYCDRPKCGMCSLVNFFYIWRGEDELYPISEAERNQRISLMPEIRKEFAKRYER